MHWMNEIDIDFVSSLTKYDILTESFIDQFSFIYTTTMGNLTTSTTE